MKKKIVAVFLAVLMVGSVAVFAGTSYNGYSTTVGKLNGNGYTSYQTKTTSGANGDLSSSTVGGSYLVDARMQEDDGTAGYWTRDVTDNTLYALDGHVNHSSGDDVRVHFSNDWNTVVNVQVDGDWRSN